MKESRKNPGPFLPIVILQVNFNTVQVHVKLPFRLKPLALPPQPAPQPPLSSVLLSPPRPPHEPVTARPGQNEKEKCFSVSVALSWPSVLSSQAVLCGMLGRPLVPPVHPV